MQTENASLARRLYLRLRFAAEYRWLRVNYALRKRGWVFHGDHWNWQYQIGAWEFLEDAEEMGRYTLIAGYIRLLSPAPSVLDAGCGSGRLVEFLCPSSIHRYVGVDVSTEAIERARARSAAKSDFAAVNFDEWTPSESFDCIVFNETLYYATKPMELIRRYAGTLSENGIIIASMMRDPWHTNMWRDIEQEFLVRHHLSVTNNRRHTFDVKVLSPRSVAVAASGRN